MDVSDAQVTHPSEGLRRWAGRLQSRSPLTPSDVAKVLALDGDVISVRSKQDFIRLGSRVDHCHLILDGMVARIAQTRNGARQLAALYISGDIADLSSALLPDACCALSTLGDSRIFRIGHDQLLDAGLSSRTLTAAMWRDTAAEVMIGSEWLLNANRRSARCRLAHLLCELAIRVSLIGYDSKRFRLPMRQEDLGDALGLTPVHVNRMLRELRELGLATVQNQVVQIVDPVGLSAEGEFNPAYLHLRTGASTFM